MFATTQPGMPRIRCAVCDKPVERIDVWQELGEKVMHIAVWCHGDKDTMEISARDYMSRGVLEQIRQQEGVAFTTKRLPTTAIDTNQHQPGQARQTP